MILISYNTMKFTTELSKRRKGGRGARGVEKERGRGGGSDAHYFLYLDFSLICRRNGQQNVVHRHFFFGMFNNMEFKFVC